MNTRLLSREEGVWRIQQVLLDSEEANDWALDFVMDLARTREAGRVQLELVDVVS